MADEPPAAPEPPKTLFDRVIVATPIVLTIIATIFAGLSGTEMNLAMYWRSVAAQDQAKSTSQWSLAGFKRDRSLIAQGQAQTLLAIAGRGPEAAGAALDAVPLAKERGTGAAWLKGEGPPKPGLPAVGEPIQSVQQALAERLPEDEVLRRAVSVGRTAVDDAIRQAEAAADDFDKLCEPALKAADDIERRGLPRRGQGPRAGVGRPGGAGGNRPPPLSDRGPHEPGHRPALRGPRGRRHGRVGPAPDQEQELLLRDAHGPGRRHHRVGGAAQRQKSLFWMLASIAGVLAILFGVYVYLAI